jgi:hypothetical protein
MVLTEQLEGSDISKERGPLRVVFDVGVHFTLLFEREVRIRQNLLFDVIHEQERC